MQGEDKDVLRAVAQDDLEHNGLSEADRVLLDFARTLTLKPAQVTDQQVVTLREHGWSEDQISEAVYVIALFAFFNRVADAFGLASPGYLDFNPKADTAE